MIDKDTMISVVNKYGGIVGYTVHDLGIHRNFYPNETKQIRFEELEKLSYEPGGATILKDFLEIKNDEAISLILNQEMEPEYHYTINDIKEVMLNGTLDQFLDCLDFAPKAVQDQIKDLAVQLPLNDMAKREAINDKLGFDVTMALTIKNTKLDGGEEGANTVKKSNRRTAPLKNPAPTGRRYTPDKK